MGRFQKLCILGAMCLSSIVNADTALTWEYYALPDSMGKGTSYFAHVDSENTVNFNRPYSGSQRGRLTLRSKARTGKDILLTIDKGQIICHSYDCHILVRFDDSAPMKFSGSGPADLSSNILFIHDYDRFIKNMVKAKKVRIEINVFHNGTPVFEFNVDKFDQKLYLPNAKK